MWSGLPAEEGGGGKVIMLDAGAFDDVHAAMMVHPWATERLEATCLAVHHFDVAFAGRTAHASAAPWQGINAGDAMVVAQVALGLLRQQLPPGDQLHGVVTDGGEAANIIPSRVTGRFMARSHTLQGLEQLVPRIEACFAAGALATGADVSFTPLAPDYSHMESDPDLLARYRTNAEALGRRFDLDDRGAPRPTLSTDMANVSLAVPTIHPLLAIESHGAVNHQPEFAAACVTDSADTAVRDGRAGHGLDRRGRRGARGPPGPPARPPRAVTPSGAEPDAGPAADPTPGPAGHRPAIRATRSAPSACCSVPGDPTTSTPTIGCGAIRRWPGSSTTSRSAAPRPAPSSPRCAPRSPRPASG